MLEETYKAKHLTASCSHGGLDMQQNTMQSYTYACLFTAVPQEFNECKNCVASCNREGLMSRLDKQQTELEMCEKALADYMESKRRAFPRFYFVSSADLLDILSNGNNPVKVMQHMSKCFQVSWAIM